MSLVRVQSGVPLITRDLCGAQSNITRAGCACVEAVFEILEDPHFRLWEFIGCHGMWHKKIDTNSIDAGVLSPPLFPRPPVRPTLRAMVFAHAAIFWQCDPPHPLPKNPLPNTPSGSIGNLVCWHLRRTQKPTTPNASWVATNPPNQNPPKPTVHETSARNRPDTGCA